MPTKIAFPATWEENGHADQMEDKESTDCEGTLHGMGRNERKYRECYESSVNAAISFYGDSHAHRLKNVNYVSMSEVEKKHAIDDVHELLLRLGERSARGPQPAISRKKSDGKSLSYGATITTDRNDPNVICSSTPFNDQSLLFKAGLGENYSESQTVPVVLFQTQTETSVNTSKFDYGESTDSDSQFYDETRETISSNYVQATSTEGKDNDTSFLTGTSVQENAVEVSAVILNDHCSPVELVRKYENENNLSPVSKSSPLSGSFTTKKRTMTTSGKKGADMQRIRANIDENDFDIHSYSGFIDSPSQLLGPSLSEQWKGPSPSFLEDAPTSPIQPRDDIDSIASMQSNLQKGPPTPIQFRNKENGVVVRRLAINDTIESVNCTVLPRRIRNRGGINSDYGDEAPADIRLKDGSFYHLDPLHVQRPPKERSRRRSKSADTLRERSPFLSIPDPFSPFHERMAERLTVVADWLVEHDGDVNLTENQDEIVRDDTIISDDYKQKGVLVSMSMTQIIAVTIKLLLIHGANPYRRKYNIEDSNKLSTLKGGTVIVLRSKSDVKAWECAFRERTAYSVLNHSSMPSGERKRSKTALKCAGFDVILTTYDAIKTREKSIALDGRGRAVTKDGSQDGWYSSRSCESRPEKSETLSVLHGMKWHRVIFVDFLGRVSYIVKPGTSRARAAIALHGCSRQVFSAVLAWHGVFSLYF